MLVELVGDEEDWIVIELVVELVVVDLLVVVVELLEVLVELLVVVGELVAGLEEVDVVGAVVLAVVVV
jgi:hypothetical protein